MHTKILTVANMLTVLRIILVPLYLWLFSRWTSGSIILALIVFVTAAITDLYDGRLARQRKEITKLGKFMDPLADKILVVGALVQFWLMGLVNVWLVGVIVVRDIWVTIMRIIAIRRGTELKTSRDAKIKTTIQLTVIITTIVLTGARLTAMELFPNYNGQWVALESYRLLFNLLLSVAVVFTLYSWITYFFQGKPAKT